MVLTIRFMLIITIIIFIFGWFVFPEWPPEYYANGESHMLGLKFMPPCKPLTDADCMCGFDPILSLFLGLGWAFAIDSAGDEKKIKKPKIPEKNTRN